MDTDKVMDNDKAMNADMNETDGSNEVSGVHGTNLTLTSHNDDDTVNTNDDVVTLITCNYLY